MLIVLRDIADAAKKHDHTGLRDGGRHDGWRFLHIGRSRIDGYGRSRRAPAVLRGDR